MIPRSLEDITHKIRESKTLSIAAATGGASLVAVLGILALKADINKTYFDLSTRIDDIEHVSPAPASNVFYNPGEVHLHFNTEYRVVEPCITKNKEVYEVRPC